MGKTLYTDTDSIIIMATPEQWKLYKERFVPPVKSFGGMEVEGEGVRTVTIGPNKYVFIEESGNYTWAANGIKSKQNSGEDILAKFESVLEGNTEKVYHFAIQAGSDFELRHTKPGLCKNLRFICLKGAVEGSEQTGPDGLRVRWWTDFAEFEEYCKDLKPIGFDYSREPTTKTYKPYQSPAARIDEEVRSYHAAQLDERKRTCSEMN